MSQQVHAFIDDETYLMLKSQKVNISEMIRNALRAAVNVELPEEESELMDLIDTDKKKMSEVSKRLSENSMKLAIIQEKREQERKVQLERALALDRGLREAGALRDPRIGGL